MSAEMQILDNFVSQISSECSARSSAIEEYLVAHEVFQYQKDKKTISQQGFHEFLKDLNIETEEYENYLFEELLNPYNKKDYDINIMMKMTFLKLEGKLYLKLDKRLPILQQQWEDQVRLLLHQLFKQIKIKNLKFKTILDEQAKQNQCPNNELPYAIFKQIISILQLKMDDADIDILMLKFDVSKRQMVRYDILTEELNKSKRAVPNARAFTRTLASSHTRRAACGPPANFELRLAARPAVQNLEINAYIQKIFDAVNQQYITVEELYKSVGKGENSLEYIEKVDFENFLQKNQLSLPPEISVQVYKRLDPEQTEKIYYLYFKQMMLCCAKDVISEHVEMLALALKREENGHWFVMLSKYMNMSKNPFLALGAQFLNNTKMNKQQQIQKLQERLRALNLKQKKQKNLLKSIKKQSSLYDCDLMQFKQIQEYEKERQIMLALQQENKKIQDEIKKYSQKKPLVILDQQDPQSIQLQQQQIHRKARPPPCAPPQPHTHAHLHTRLRAQGRLLCMQLFVWICASPPPPPAAE